MPISEYLHIIHRPKTEPTRQAYEQLLNFLSGFMGDQPNDILRGAADEVLAVVKDDAIVGPAKQKQVKIDSHFVT